MSRLRIFWIQPDRLRDDVSRAIGCVELNQGLPIEIYVMRPKTTLLLLTAAALSVVAGPNITLSAAGFGGGMGGFGGRGGGFGGGARFGGGEFGGGGARFSNGGSFSRPAGGLNFGSGDFSRLPAGGAWKLTGESFGSSTPSSSSNGVKGTGRPVPVLPDVGTRLIQRPEERSNWKDWSQNRDSEWQERVVNQHQAWTAWQQSNQDRLTEFRNTQEQRWNNLQTTRSNRQDWPQYRQGLWNYRWERADQIRSDAGDLSNHYFDDRWWGRFTGSTGRGDGGSGHSPADPWWWWKSSAWRRVCAFVRVINATPYYSDFDTEVIDGGDPVYVDGQPVPAEQYPDPTVDLGASVEQPSPPTPAVEGQPEEWMPLGVFALAREQKGDAILFLQLSVNREGMISGAYSSILTEDERPIAGKVDKVTQEVAWRIGTSTNTIFVTSLANLTRDVLPVTVHIGQASRQVWLLVRMAGAAPIGQPAAIPEIERTLPPAPTPAQNSGN